MTTELAILDHLLVKHGVRPAGKPKGDQMRTMLTPWNYRAVCGLQFGADYVTVFHAAGATRLDYNDPRMVDALDRLVKYAVSTSVRTW